MTSKIPKDLGIKVGTKIEAFWTRIRDASKEAIFNAEQTMIADKSLLELAEKKIKEEKCT